MAYSINVYGSGNPSFNVQRRSGAVKYIVVHYTANGKPSTANAAKNNCIYFSGGNRSASAHFFIDDSAIWEFADPSKWSCWHVGDGGGAYGITNQNSIGIEVVQDGNGAFSASEIGRLAWLVQRLMRQFSVPASRVVRHYDASRKACPLYYTPYGAGGTSAWEALRKRITSGSTASGATEEPKSTAYADGYHRSSAFAGTYRCTVPYLRVRRSPSLSGTEVAHYTTGDPVDLEGYWWSSDGYIWGTYIGGSGNRNYVAVGRDTGKAESDDYLVRA